METVSKLIKSSIPNYLSQLPIPNTFTGIFSLGVGDLVYLSPLMTLICGGGYMTWRYLSKPEESSNTKVNLNVRKEVEKVVDICEVGDIEDKKLCYCRCWRSKKFPICDGSHNLHNDVTGDNVGPLIIKK